MRWSGFISLIAAMTVGCSADDQIAHSEGRSAISPEAYDTYECMPSDGLPIGEPWRNKNKVSSAQSARARCEFETGKSCLGCQPLINDQRDDVTQNAVFKCYCHVKCIGSPTVGGYISDDGWFIGDNSPAAGESCIRGVRAKCERRGGAPTEEMASCQEKPLIP